MLNAIIYVFIYIWNNNLEWFSIIKAFLNLSVIIHFVKIEKLIDNTKTKLMNTLTLKNTLKRIIWL